jgi:hypothetical protein
MKTPTKVATRDEIIRSMSKQLRREDLDDIAFIKLLTFYMKLSGWDKNIPTPSQAPKVDVIKTPSPLEQVLAEERKRRAKG